MPFSALTPLRERHEIAWFSLQKGPAQTQLADAPADFRPYDLTGELNDFAETAALIMNLDIVIAVDTAVAHIAGALGKPVWIMLPANADWRWLENRSDSPWYPTARLFRQTKLGDWGSAVDEVLSALS